MGGHNIHTKGEVMHTNTTCIWKDTTGIEPRDIFKRNCHWSHWKTPCTYKLCTFNAMYTGTNQKWEDTTFIQNESYFIQTKHASERIQLSLNHEIPPKGNAVIPLENALHMQAMHVLMQWIQPQILNGRIHHSYKRRRISYKHYMYLKGHNWHWTPRYLQNELPLIPLENALHIQAMHG